MKQEYKAILFHPEGDFVTDFYNMPTKQDVWDKVADMGSRWIFYPIIFVATGSTIVSTPDGLEWMEGKRIKTIQQYLKDRWATDKDSISEHINYGIPLGWVYPEPIKRQKQVLKFSKNTQS